METELEMGMGLETAMATVMVLAMGPAAGWLLVRGTVCPSLCIRRSPRSAATQLCVSANVSAQ